MIQSTFFSSIPPLLPNLANVQKPASTYANPWLTIKKAAQEKLSEQLHHCIDATQRRVLIQIQDELDATLIENIPDRLLSSSPDDAAMSLLFSLKQKKLHLLEDEITEQHKRSDVPEVLRLTQLQGRYNALQTLHGTLPRNSHLQTCLGEELAATKKIFDNAFCKQIKKIKSYLNSDLSLGLYSDSYSTHQTYIKNKYNNFIIEARDKNEALLTEKYPYYADNLPDNLQTSMKNLLKRKNDHQAKINEAITNLQNAEREEAEDSKILMELQKKLHDLEKARDSNKTDTASLIENIGVRKGMTQGIKNRLKRSSKKEYYTKCQQELNNQREELNAKMETHDKSAGEIRSTLRELETLRADLKKQQEQLFSQIIETLNTQTITDKKIEQIIINDKKLKSLQPDNLKDIDTLLNILSVQEHHSLVQQINKLKETSIIKRKMILSKENVERILSEIEKIDGKDIKSDYGKIEKILAEFSLSRYIKVPSGTIDDAAALSAMLCVDKIVRHPLSNLVAKSEGNKPKALALLQSLEQLMQPDNEPRIQQLRNIINHTHHEALAVAEDFTQQIYLPEWKIWNDLQGPHGTCTIHSWNNVIANMTNNQQMLMTPYRIEKFIQAQITNAVSDLVGDLLEGDKRSSREPMNDAIDQVLDLIYNKLKIIYYPDRHKYLINGNLMDYKEIKISAGLFRPSRKIGNEIVSNNINVIDHEFFSFLGLHSEFIPEIIHPEQPPQENSFNLLLLETKGCDAIALGLSSKWDGHALTFIKHDAGYLLIDSNYPNPINITPEQLVYFILKEGPVPSDLKEELERRNYNKYDSLEFSLGLYKKESN